MTPVTLFSYITPEEQERMRICFDMHEAVYRNNETVMEYSSSMKKIGLILYGGQCFTVVIQKEIRI